MLSNSASIRTTALTFILFCPAAFMASPASAASLVTFVSGQGTDSGSCASPAHACRTFAFALGVTSAGGEIKALDPANYGRVTINQSVSITGVQGASINGAGNNAILVNAGANDVVNISDLTLDGKKAGSNGLVVARVGSLNVRNCVVRNYTSDGIHIAPPSGTTFFRFENVESSENGANGFYFNAKNSAVSNGVLDHVKLHHNASYGLEADRDSNSATLNLVVNDSEATNNSIGIYSGAQGKFVIHRSVSTNNAYGLYVNTQMGSTGDNLVYGNTTADLAGSTFTVTPK